MNVTPNVSSVIATILEPGLVKVKARFFSASKEMTNLSDIFTFPITDMVRCNEISGYFVTKLEI